MTDKEIIRALRLCGKIDSNCRECKLWGDDRCVEHLAGAAADLIERLTAENVVLPDGQASAIESLRKEIEWKDMVIALAQKEQAKAEAERDALREKVPQWISVEDRLPEVWKNEENDVLVNYMIYAPEFGADIGNYHAKAKRWLCMAIPCTVTHWMPLPEAPEEE